MHRTGRETERDTSATGTGTMLDVREMSGLPDNVLYVISELDPNDILLGETVAHAYTRLGLAVRLDLTGELGVD